MKSLRVQHSLDHQEEAEKGDLDVDMPEGNGESDPLLDSLEMTMPSPEDQMTQYQQQRRKSKNIQRLKGGCKALLMLFGCLFVLIVVAMAVFLGLLYTGSLPVTEYHLLPGGIENEDGSKYPESDTGNPNLLMEKLKGGNMTDFKVAQVHESGLSVQFNVSFPPIEKDENQKLMKGIDSVIRWLTTNMTLQECNWTLSALSDEQVAQIQLSHPIRDVSVYDMTQLQNISFDIMNINGTLLGQHISRHFLLDRTQADILPLIITSISNVAQILNGIQIPLPPIQISTQLNITSILAETSILNARVAEYDILKRTALIAFDLDYSANISLDSTQSESEWHISLDCIIEHKNGAKINLVVETLAFRLTGHRGEVHIKISPLQKSQDTLIIQARSIHNEQQLQINDDGPTAWSWLEILKMLATENGRRVLIGGSVITMDNFRFDTRPQTIPWLDDLANGMHLRVNMSMYQ